MHFATSSEGSRLQYFVLVKIKILMSVIHLECLSLPAVQISLTIIVLGSNSLLEVMRSVWTYDCELFSTLTVHSWAKNDNINILA
jgi:hypothetical protein